jgi:hypothetical protein
MNALSLIIIITLSIFIVTCILINRSLMKQLDWMKNIQEQNYRVTEKNKLDKLARMIQHDTYHLTTTYPIGTWVIFDHRDHENSSGLGIVIGHRPRTSEKEEYAGYSLKITPILLNGSCITSKCEGRREALLELSGASVFKKCSPGLLHGFLRCTSARERWHFLTQEACGSNTFLNMSNKAGVQVRELELCGEEQKWVVHTEFAEAIDIYLNGGESFKLTTAGFTFDKDPEFKKRTPEYQELLRQSKFAVVGTDVIELEE